MSSMFRLLMDRSWDELKSANFFTSISYAMEAKLGAFFYVIFFGTPWLMMMIKTRDWTIPTMFMLWTISLYGYLMPSTIASEHMSLAISIGFGIMIFKALSVLK